MDTITRTKKENSLPILKTRDVHFILAVYEIKNHVIPHLSLLGQRLEPFASQLIDLTSCSHRFC